MLGDDDDGSPSYELFLLRNILKVAKTRMAIIHNLALFRQEKQHQMDIVAR